MAEVTLTGFNGEVIAQSEIPEPLPAWVERPTAAMNPDVEFDEDSVIMRIPGINEHGPEPWIITVEKYALVGDGVYRRVR